MALAHVESLHDPDHFVQSVARNIRSLLAMRGMAAQDLAGHIGMAAPKLSQRMSGKSRWLAIELDAIARAFEVDTDVIFAASEQEFREALARSRCSSEFDLADGLDEIGARKQIPGQRRVAIAV